MHPFSSLRAGFLFCLATLGLSAAEIPEVIPLWPGKPPGSEKITFAEKITERSTSTWKHDRFVSQIAEPSLTLFRPRNPNGAVVIVAPGGGWVRIVLDKEGADTAAWLNKLGVTVFLLKYRLATEGHENAQDVGLQDAQRAMRLVRTRASGWGLDPKRIGFLGFSAGGHLAATIEFFSDKRVYQPVDDADTAAARPDFSILGYAPAGALPSTGRSASVVGRMLQDYRIVAAPGAKYPPTFILHADDDPAVPAQNAAMTYLELKKAGATVEMHVFKSGGHGFGVREAEGPVARWPELCADWLREIGVLGATGKP